MNFLKHALKDGEMFFFYFLLPTEQVGGKKLNS